MLTSKCPHCGSFNDESAALCYMCKKDLPAAAAGAGIPADIPPSASGPERDRRSGGYRRPGCVSVYALLTFLSGGLGVLLALYLPTLIADFPSLMLESSNAVNQLPLSDPEFLPFLRKFMMFYSIGFFLLSIFSLLLGWGLWTMRNWARILILITQGFSLATGIFGIFYSIVMTNGNLFVCGINFLSLVFPGIIFFWFFMNRRLFR